MPFETIAMTQGTQEWLHWRRGGLGASDAPCLMGENPWKSRARLLQEKLRPGDFNFTNAAMERGTRLEPHARASYCAFRNIRVEPTCIQSSDRPWMRASLDGLHPGEKVVVEIKCGESAYKFTAARGTVPRYYYGQLQHILAVTEYDFIDYWSYWPGCKPMHLEVPRDQEYIDRLIENELEFWTQFGPPAAVPLVQISSVSRP